MAEPEVSQGSAPPDLMNDPQYATNTTTGDDGTNDADTCRICRGEAAENEPLFYPCKCSGSIKFVHQDCLMEWLSHSQKKHCELCKTPFRFTKLYSPQMPQQLPTSVFARHLAINTYRNIKTWLRFCVVITVWLGILPYVIRQVWRFLFWFSDGGWPSQYLPASSINSTAGQALEIARELQLATLTGNGTSPVTPILASQTTSASIGGVVEKLRDYIEPLSQILNVSSSDPLAAGLLKSLYFGFGLYGIIPDVSQNNSSIPRYIMNMQPAHRTPSLLSDVNFFKNLTRSSFVNSLVIHITEGYVITFLVVVSFILVFLIREWVVQQQPGINMGAGFNAEFAAGERRRNRDVREARIPNAPNNAVAMLPANEPAEQRPMVRPRRRVRFDEGNNEDGGNIGAQVNAQAIRRQELRPMEPDLAAGPGEASTHNRPVLPTRDALAPAAEIQRRLIEEPKMTREFLEIWKQADADPIRVLQIIEMQGLSEQMAYWVSAMKILQNPNGASIQPAPTPPARSLPGFVAAEGADSDEDRQHTRTNSTNNQTDVLRSGASAEGQMRMLALGARHGNILQGIPTGSRQQELQDLSDEGKGKAKENRSEPLFDPMTQLLPGIDSQRFSKQDIDSSSSDLLEPPTQRAVPGHTENESTSSDSSTWSFAGLPPSEPSLGIGTTDEASTLFDKITLEDALEDSKMAKDGANPDETERAWKDIQTHRVQEAVARGREALQDRTQSSQSSYSASSQQKAHREPDATQDPSEPSGQDENERSVHNWNEAFVEAHVDSTVGAEVDVNQNGLADINDPDRENQEANPAVDAVAPLRLAEQQGIFDHVADWLWGRPQNERRQDEDGDDEHIVRDLAAEAPFVPRQLAPNDNLGNDGVLDPNDFEEQDREVVEAAIAAGLDPNDPDIDDAEDFEGIMELVGMRGPLTGLVQNALFSAFLLALAVAIGVWIPYNIGRVALLLTANPGPALKLPLRVVFGCVELFQDCSLAVMGFIAWIVVYMIYWPLKALFSILYLTGTTGCVVVEKFTSLSAEASQAASAAFYKGMAGAGNGILTVADSDLLAFSAASHESLLSLRLAMITIFEDITSLVGLLLAGDYRVRLADIGTSFLGILSTGRQMLPRLFSLVIQPDSWVITLEAAKRLTPLDPELSIWNSWDRFWATFAGYTTLSILGALYVQKGSPFSTGQVGREWEATIIDLLHQAGGVMKVILIISIEMLVFPLYCGLLLDAALLPLFENTTITSRVLFTMQSPLTSIFVHWFVGTCYMFHFALFVSMCRKIMRKGVLYFIRDPDDPTFHPVRDVLERNVATQLRKILFSALVYGALVVICLGGVVWGLAFAFKSVLPIHWSSNEPVLEFPIDLLFYNFLMPLAVRFFKPSDGLHAMYRWWFRRCARVLRLTWFMFDERKHDEEGHYIDQSWADVLHRFKGDILAIEPPEPSGTAFVSDGKYVRTPASDQVRIPKENNVFLEVNEANERIDGVEDRPDGLHGRDSAMFKQVYIPPHFRLRIFAFILSIWLFAAVTGVSITIVPLVFGREIFAHLIPSHVRQNDVYAFSIGIYILGSLLYAILHAHHFVAYLRRTLTANTSTRDFYRRVILFSSRVARIGWVAASFVFVLPTLSSLLVELYFLIPAHTYFGKEQRHVIHFVQSWTLGLLYVKLTQRIILWHEDSRPAEALRAITRNGYLDPDARLATRSFILPATLVLGTLIALPWGLAHFACKFIFKGLGEREVMLVFRYAYPMVLGVGIWSMACWTLAGIVKGWRQKIKDEVYLIGERLHNFGDNRKVGAASAGALAGVRRIDT